METADVTPCPECRQAIPQDARVCPFCRRALLVDVLVQGAVADARSRYQASRAIRLSGTVDLVLEGADERAARVRFGR